MPTQDEYNFFLNSDAEIVQYETLELIHPNLSKTYYFVRNAVDGITATLETAVSKDFEYVPMKITPSSAVDDLDYAIRIELGDVGEIVPQELDLIQVASGFLTKPTVNYRTFRSDDLSEPLLGPLKLEIGELTFTKDGCGFEARAPQLNINKTGEFYNTARFPMLLAFL